MKLTQLGSLYKLIRGESRNMRKSVAKQPRQRASAFVLESLENRVLLSATPMDVTTTEPVVTAAVVTTDKADYAPGETALITTSNTSADGLKFGDGELVQFQVTRTDGIQDAPMGNLPWFVIDGVSEDAHLDFDANGQAVDRNADGLADWIRPDNDGTVNGSISTDWFVEDQYLGASLRVTATGQDSGAVATTEFTDALSITSLSQSSGTTLGGTSITITGAGYTPGQEPLTVSFDGGTTFVSATRIDNTHLTATTPAHSAGTFNVIVQDKGGAPGATLVNGFTYVNATTTTTTTVSSNSSTSTYGNSVTFTATVARTTGTGAPTGSVTFNIAGIGTGLVGTAGATTATAATWTYTTTATALTAGNHSVQAFYAHSGSFIDSNDTLSGGQTVNKATATVVVAPYNVASYDANSHTATYTITGVDAGGAALGTSIDVSNTTHTDAGTYSTDTWSFTGGTNYNNILATTITDSIAKASSTTTTVGAGPFTYDGSTHSGGSGTVTGAGVITGSASLTYSGDQVNAGTYSVTAHYAGDANHFGSDGAAVTITIDKATLTGLATTQSALNIAKQGALVFSLNSVTGMVNGDTLVSLLSSMSFTLKIGTHCYAYAPSVAIDTHGDGDASNDTVVVTYSLKNGGDLGQLAADLQLLNISDGTDSTSASNAKVDAIWVNMSTANYTFSDDALTKLFNSLK